MPDKPARPHSTSEQQIARQLIKAPLNYALNSKAFWKLAISRYFQIVERATVVRVKNTGSISQVQIQRPGQRPQADKNWYSVWDSMYVPRKGDVVLLLRGDDKQWYVMGAQNAGSANTLRVAQQGDKIVFLDAAGRQAAQLTDTHALLIARKDGSRGAHNLGEDGTHTHTGDHRQVGGNMALNASSAAPSTMTRVTGGNTRSVYIDTKDGRGDQPLHDRNPSLHREYIDTGRGNNEKGAHTRDYYGLGLPKGHSLSDDDTTPQLYTPSSAPPAVGIASPNPTSLPDGSVLVAYAYTTPHGGLTDLSPVASVAITAGQQVQITVPTRPTGASGNVFYYASDGIDSTNLLFLGQGTETFILSAFASGGAPPADGSNNTADPDPTTGPVLAASYAAGTLPAGSYNVCYAWNGPCGQSAMSPRTNITLTSTGQIQVSSIPAPVGTSQYDSVTLYMSPVGTGNLLALVAVQKVTVAGHTFPYSTTLSGPPGPGALGPQTTNNTQIANPTVAPTLVPQTPTVSTPLPGGTYKACYSLNAGSNHTAASPTRTFSVGAGQAAQLGPVEYPGNATGITWYMSQVGGSTMYQVATGTSGAAVSINFVPPNTNPTSPTINNTAAQGTGNLTTTHGSGRLISKADGHDKTFYHAPSGTSVKHTVHKEGGSTHKYKADGSTINHHVSPEGHSKRLGKNLHNATSLTDNGDGTVTEKGGHAHNHANGQYEHSFDSSGTGTYTRLRAHHAAQGEKVYSVDGATIAHHRHPGGHVRHVGEHIHGAAALADDGTATPPYMRHIYSGGNQRYERYINLNDGHGDRLHKSHGSGFERTFLDDGTGTGTQINTHVATRSGTGGVHQYKQHGTASYHQQGDDGTGKHAITHASGSRVLDHDGTVIRHFAGAGNATQPVYNHDGATLTHLTAAGKIMHTHNGDTLVSYAAGNAVFSLTTYAHGDLHGVIEIASGSAWTPGAGHWVGDDGVGKVHLRHGSGNRVLDHDGTTKRVFAGGENSTPVWSHDGTTHKVYTQVPGTFGMTLMSTLTRQGTSTMGAVLGLRQHGSGGAMHQWGDDGTGKAFVGHASGNKVLDHDGTSPRYYGGAHGFFQYRDLGVPIAQITSANPAADSAVTIQAKRLANSDYHKFGDDGGGRTHLANPVRGKAWHYDHNTDEHGFFSFTPGNGMIMTGKHKSTATQAGQFHALQNNSFTAFHNWGDDGTGQNQHYSQGQVYKYTNNNVTGRKYTWNSDIHFGTWNQQHDYSSSSEVRISDGSGTFAHGYLKQLSHSLTVVYDTQSGQGLNNATSFNTIPTGATPGGSHMVDTTATGGSSSGFAGTTNNNPLFKSVAHCIWNPSGPQGNPGYYALGIPNWNDNFHWGTWTYLGSSRSGYAAWSATHSDADTGFLIAGASYNNPGSWNSFRTTLYHLVN